MANLLAADIAAGGNAAPPWPLIKAPAMLRHKSLNHIELRKI